MPFTAVRSFDTYIPASMMMQRLEEEGIKVYLKDEHTVTLSPMFSHAIGGIKLMVYNDQLERAMELISGFEKLYLEAGACPRCGSLNVQYITRQNPANWIAGIISWFFGSYAVPIKQVYHCYECTYEFETLPEGQNHERPLN